VVLIQMITVYVNVIFPHPPEESEEDKQVR
jgi:hypothetical protein